MVYENFGQKELEAELPVTDTSNLEPSEAEMFIEPSSTLVSFVVRTAIQGSEHMYSDDPGGGTKGHD